MSDALPACIAFEDGKRIAAGTAAQVAVAVKRRLSRKDHGRILMFDHASGKVLDLNLGGTERDVAARYERQAELDRLDQEEKAAPRGPGRPKLGVVAREVTLLPRHWEWLNAQPGGASVALRKLVEEARKSSRDRKRVAQEAAFRFMSAIAGDLPGYEEAARALFAGDAEKFDAMTAAWPGDVRGHSRLLAGPAFGAAKAARD